jgi:glycosyltransferase involved in cell wall biosynthesis
MAERILPLAPEPGVSRSLWMAGQVERQLRGRGAALFHGLANFDLPLSKPPGTRFVLTIHDLIPLEWPDSVSKAHRLQFRGWLSRCLHLADALICPTQAVALAVQAAFPSAPRARVIHMGVDLKRPPAAEREAAAYFLALGSVEVRKNLSILARAFDIAREHWRQAGVELWIAGQLGFGGAAILEALKGQAGVRVLGPQSPRAAAKLLRGALALCAPSLAEGFGLPPLEAMAQGIPVLASDIPAHREVLGDAAVLLSPNDPEAWSSAMLRLAGDADLGRGLAGLGSARASELTWARTARETQALYSEVLRADWSARS